MISCFGNLFTPPRTQSFFTRDQFTDDIQIIIDRYENHPSILQIKEQMNDINTNFEFQQATEAEIASYLMSLNPKKPPGYDKIPPKLVKLSSDILSNH